MSLKPRLVNQQEYPLYPATVMDAGIAYEAVKGDSKMLPEPNYFLAAAACIDLPFSIVFDTLFLPYDLWQRNSRTTEEITASTEDKDSL